ncbi:MAG: rane protein of unknown function [Gammaproteobacteria bacterium]|jgi:DHA1 family tetracycline resistance protein-like MFS transporter|nr:rane protein of unknown function [Gammaproteobacteria bacterium]
MRLKHSQITTLAILIWVVFIDSLGWGIAFSVFATLFLNSHPSILSASISASSRYMLYEFLLAIYSLFMFIFAPVLGGIADHYGRKPGLLISMFGLTIGFLMCASGCYWGSLWFLIAGRIISGITAGSVSVAQAAIVDISTAKTKSFNLSTLMLANTLGFSLGPVLGSVFEHFSMNLPVGTLTFLIGAAMSLIGFLALLFFFRETYTRENLNQKLNFWQNFANIKTAFCMPIVSKYLYSILFAMTGFVLFFANIPIFLARIFPEYAASTGLLLSAEAILFSFTLMFAGKYLFARFSKDKTVMLSQLVQVVSCIALSICLASFLTNVALFTIISCFAGVMYIGLLTLISDSTDSQWQGRIMGVVAALSSISWGSGPLLTGALNHFGPGVPFIVGAVLISIGILVVLKGHFKHLKNTN